MIITFRFQHLSVLVAYARQLSEGFSWRSYCCQSPTDRTNSF